jgi:hypothetical protein
MTDSTSVAASSETDIERPLLISERAYFIWESEGRPDGAHDEHWLRAEREHDRAAAESALPSAR